MVVVVVVAVGRCRRVVIVVGVVVVAMGAVGDRCRRRQRCCISKTVQLRYTLAEFLNTQQAL